MIDLNNLSDKAQQVLDEFIFDVKSSEASLLNSKGPEAQLAYLRQIGYPDKSIRQQLAIELGDRSDEG